MDKYAFTPCPFPNHERGLMFWKGFQPWREVLIKKRHGVVFFSAIVLLLASIAVPNLNANDLYPNCIITAIDANSGLVTSQETSSGKTFYFQVTDRAQLGHLTIHQGIWINNGHVSLDGVKPCACNIVNSPADVPSGSNRKAPESAGPASSASAPSPQLSTITAASPPSKNAGQAASAARPGAAAKISLTSPIAAHPVATVPGSDLLVLRDGKRISGHLEACGITTCLIGTSVFPRQSIAWIGLGLNQKLQAALPTIKDATRDEVHLADASIHTGTLLGVHANSVATVSASYDRAKVSWVHLALASANKQPIGFEDISSPDAENKPSTGDPGVPGSGSLASGSSTPPKRKNGPHDPDSSGALWIGIVHGDTVVTWTTPPPGAVHHFTNDDEVRLREVGRQPITSSFPKFHYVGWIVSLKNELTKVRVGYDGPRCFGGSGEASTSYSDAIPEGWYWYKTVDEPIKIGSANGTQIPPDGLYHLSFGTGGPIVLPACQNPRGGQMHEDQLGGRPIEIGYMWGPGASPPDRTTLQAQAADPEGFRAMSANRTRMVGSYNYDDHYKDGWSRRKVDWNICRAGSARCSMAPPDFNQDPCSGVTQANGLLDNCTQERNAKVDELRKVWDEYQKHMAAGQENQGAYRTAVAECAAWEAAQKILLYAVGNAPVAGGVNAKTALEIKEFREALELFADISSKMINGENPLTIPDGKGLEGLAALQWAGETVSQVLSILKAANPEAMQGKLEECGAPVPDATYAGAVAYVKNLKEALDLLPEVQTIVNDIRQKDLECQDDQWKAYQACVECARSQGKDESDCDHLKPDGNWPPVR